MLRGLLVCPENKDFAAFKDPSKKRLQPLLLLPTLHHRACSSCLTLVPAPSLTTTYYYKEEGVRLSSLLRKDPVGSSQL